MASWSSKALRGEGAESSQLLGVLVRRLPLAAWALHPAWPPSPSNHPTHQLYNIRCRPSPRPSLNVRILLSGALRRARCRPRSVMARARSFADLSAATAGAAAALAACGRQRGSCLEAAARRRQASAGTLPAPAMACRSGPAPVPNVRLGGQAALPAGPAGRRAARSVRQADQAAQPPAQAAKTPGSPTGHDLGTAACFPLPCAKAHCATQRGKPRPCIQTSPLPVTMRPCMTMVATVALAQ